ncbi:MAG: Acyl carrier protein [Candidatus Dichloromethanomonas elyunquensis]|nr:MAG: Acyl carrier protein [Candidatus Dichloromethanomonas elyunquensis]
MLNSIKEILDREFLYEGSLTPETRLIEDIGSDSLDLPIFVISLEEKFDIQLSDGEIEQFITIGDVIKILEKKVAIKKEPECQ